MFFAISPAFFALIGTAVLLPAVAFVAYRFSVRPDASSGDNTSVAAEQGARTGLSLDTSSHSVASVDASGHSAVGATTGSSGGTSFSRFFSNPSAILTSAKSHFSELQQGSPMRTPEPPTRNPMSRPDVAV